MEEAMVESIEGLLSPNALATVRRIFEEELALERSGPRDIYRSRILEIELRRKNGSSFCAEIKASFLRDTAGKAIGLLGIARDISERKHTEAERAVLEAQIRQSQKMDAIGTLAGGIAHDFNNILGAIMGFAEMALDEVPENVPFRGDLERILQAGMRATSLVKQILSFSRQTRQERQLVLMHFTIKEALRLLRASLPSSIEIRQRMTTEGRIMGDSTEIHQVLMNLCTNAGLAMREQGGILQVELDEIDLNPAAIAEHPGLNAGRFVRLTVSDTGCGIPPEVIGRIFEPFFTTRPDGQGTGLGLSVVHGIVRSYGGEITVCSDVGKGSSFVVLLPAAEVSGVFEKEQRNLTLPGQERILFIDDEQALVELAMDSLVPLGYRVSAFTRSSEALDAFQKAPGDFDLVITDMTMPGLIGEDLAIRIREIRPEIPIILATGFSTRMSATRAAELGIQELVNKPILMSELTGIIRRICNPR